MVSVKNFNKLSIGFEFSILASIYIILTFTVLINGQKNKENRTTPARRSSPRSIYFLNLLPLTSIYARAPLHFF